MLKTFESAFVKYHKYFELHTKCGSEFEKVREFTKLNFLLFIYRENI